MVDTEQTNTFEWQLRRLLILQRDNFTCTECGKKSNLHVHHVKYNNDLKYWEYPDEYLKTLCSSCHSSVHTNTPKGDFYINNRIAKYKFPVKLMKLFAELEIFKPAEKTIHKNDFAKGCSYWFIENPKQQWITSDSSITSVNKTFKVTSNPHKALAFQSYPLANNAFRNCFLARMVIGYTITEHIFE